MASVKNVRPVLVSCVGGNSHAGLPVFLAVVPYEPECRVDRDCPPQLSCIEEHCVNVCQTRNPCAGDLECSVLDTSTGKRVVACSCPAGFVASNNAFCEQGTRLIVFLGVLIINMHVFSVQVQAECTRHEECADPQICHQGSCQNACRFEQCGINAICKAQDHVAKCECLPGYKGKPNRECRKRK